MDNETKENHARLEAVAQTNGFQRSIAKTQAWINKVNRMVHVMFRQVRAEREHVNTNAELFMDQIAFELGPDILKPENRKTLAVFATNYAKEEVARRQTSQERKEWREMQGPLAEFADDEPMEDLGGNAEWADALCKADPELKKYRKDLI